MMDDKALARFEAKVARQPNGCLAWTGAIARGYGRFYLNGRIYQAHVIAWQHYAGREVPPGHDIGHTCHDSDKSCQGGVCAHRACVEFDHLAPMTRQENVLAGRKATDTCPNGHPASNRRASGQCRICHNAQSSAVRKAKRTHCPKGHEYAGDNLGVMRNGHRFCRTCARLTALNMRKAKLVKSS